MKNRKRNFTAGFTLIELLVVIAIIGILSAIIISSLSSARDKGKDGSAKSSMSSMRSSAELYYNGDGGHKYSTAGTNVDVAPLDGATGGTENVCVYEDMIKLAVGVVNNLPAGNHVSCAVGQNGDSYVAYTTLNDGSIFCVDSQAFVGTPTGGGPFNGGASTDAKCQ